MKTYASKFAPGEMVEPQNWLAEYMCERQARKKGRGLPPFFWRLPEWATEYRIQVSQAVRLINTYSAAALSRALRTTEGLKILSLKAPWLDDIVRAEQAKIETANAASNTEPSTPPPANYGAAPAGVSRPNKLSKLKGL